MITFTCQASPDDALTVHLAHDGAGGYHVEIAVVEDDHVQSVCLTPDDADRLGDELSRLAEVARTRRKAG